MSLAGPDEVVSEEGPLLTTWGAGLAVGRYTLMGKLAAGGMAEIWLARQAGPKGFEKVVVIKKILDSLCQDDGFVEMFLDEARTAAQLNHQNVVQVYDLGEHNRAYFIAMEYLAGETVARVARSAVKRGSPLPYPLAARIVADAAAGLGYAHAKKNLAGEALNIVHRDVSPQNLILTYEGHLKVLDFGVARAANRVARTEEGKFKGKTAYMSPEQARAEPIDRRADLFALGIILYELIGRCRLFQHDDFVTGLKAVASPEPIPSPLTRNPEVPEGLARIALKALERDPAARYQSAEELRADLEEWLRTQPSPPGAPELSAFMRQLFAERIEKTTKLIESARAGLISALDSSVGKLGTPVDEPSMPRSGVRPPPRRRLGWIAGGVGLAAAVLVTLGLALRERPVEAAPPVAPLAAVAPPASLLIETEPPGATVTLDGVPLGLSPVTVPEVTLGSHAVRAVKEAHEPGERTVELRREGERTNLLLTLKPLAPELEPLEDKAPKVARGKLTLNSTPWSQVYEGNRKLGETPLVELSLPAGKHSLRLKNPERKLLKTITVEIRAGKTTLVREKL